MNGIDITPPEGEILLLRNLQIGKVAFGARSDPQGHSAFLRFVLHVVDDQAELLAGIDVEARLAAVDFNSVPGPDPGLQIDVRLILLRSFLPRLREVEIRVRTVLGRMVPPHLIVGPAVRGSEIDVLVAPGSLKPKSDADEAASAFAGTGSRLAGQIHFDRAVAKPGV